MPPSADDVTGPISVYGDRIPRIRAVAFENQDMPRKTTAMRPRHLELWFCKGAGAGPAIVVV